MVDTKLAKEIATSVARIVAEGYGVDSKLIKPIGVAKKPDKSGAIELYRNF